MSLLYFFKSDKPSITPTVVNTPKIANNITSVTLSQNTVVVYPDHVDINLDGDENPNLKSLSVTVDQYPNIFKKNTENDRINIQEINTNNNIKLIQISRHGPYHGTIGAFDYIRIDPKIGKVVDSGLFSYFDRIYFNNACTSCSLPALRFREYKQDEGSYVLINNKHRNEFKNLLIQINDRLEKEKCTINKKEMFVTEALKTANDNDKCDDYLPGPKYPYSPAPDYFVTIGQIKQIIKDISRVINGENIDPFEGYVVINE